MTLKEFRVMVEAHEEKSKRDMELLAWTCANLMNCWVKKKIKPRDLLPRNFRKTESVESNAYVQSRFAEKQSGKKSLEDFKAMMRARQEKEEDNIGIPVEEEDDSVLIVLDRELEDFLPDEGVSDD